MITEETRDKWKRKLNTIKKAENTGTLNLNDWELSFIDSIDIKLSKNEDISFKQSSILSKIYDKI